MTSMKPKEVAEFIRTTVNTDGMPSIHIWGGPGVGKSRVCRDVAIEEKMGFIDMRLSMKDPTDIKGLPAPENGKARWLPPSELPTEGRGILFLDELNLAPPLVQASAYQLVLDRKIGEYVLPPGWKIIAAGNKAEHSANVFRMAAPLRNRFIHIDFEVDHDSWLDWALKHGIVSEVIEFINYRPDKLFAFNADKHENAFPTPRSWEFISQIIKCTPNLNSSIRYKAIEGTVGTGAALEFKAYITLKNELPNIDEILAGQNHLAKQPDVACALATALVIRARPENFERLLQYSEEMASQYREVAVLMVKLMAMKDKQALIESPSWKRLSVNEYFDLLS